MLKVVDIYMLLLLPTQQKNTSRWLWKDLR